MNETMQELARLEGQMKALEQSADAHEAAARADRAKRVECKLRCAELRAVINDAALIHHAETTAKAAVESQQLAATAHQSVVASATAAQAAHQSAAELLAALQAKSEQLDAKSAQLDALLAKATTPVPPEAE